jgi:hypothetical protein
MGFVLSGVVISQDCAREMEVERALLLRNGYALAVTEERWMMGGDAPPAHILDMASSLSRRSRAVYVEAEFFGGIGAQAAIGYDHGAESFGPLRTQSLGGDFVGFVEVPVDQGAINVALEWLGVPAEGGEDRFTAIGLNGFRAATAEEVTFAGALPRDGGTTLWRPVGRNELALIEATGFGCGSFGVRLFCSGDYTMQVA